MSIIFISACGTKSKIKSSSLTPERNNMYGILCFIAFIFQLIIT